jgi:ParB-like chromosome segregation protein Spo0J
MISIIEIENLKMHEMVVERHVIELREEIIRDGVLKRPIVVDSNTMVVLDGHHRLCALRDLGYRKVPVIFVDYSSPDIQVEGWQIGRRVTKEDVVHAGLGGKRLPPKTSRHLVRVADEWKHISAIEELIDCPLEILL